MQVILAGCSLAGHELNAMALPLIRMKAADVIAEYAELLKGYNVTEVQGDNFARSSEASWARNVSLSISRTRPASSIAAADAAGTGYGRGSPQWAVRHARPAHE
jgi:hypothetical protein